MTRKILTICAGLVVAAGTSSASTTCVTTTLATLISGGFTCSWTSVSFSTITFGNFSLINNDDGVGGQVAPSGWAVTFLDTGTAFRITLTPGAGITETSAGSGQGQLYQFLMNYTATDVLGPGGSGAMISEVAGLTGSAQTNGSTQFVKTVKNGAGTTLGSPSDLINTTPTSTATSMSTFAPQTSLTILDSVNISSGTNAGAFATLNSFYNQLGVASAVPEPGSAVYSLFGVVLSAVGLFGRRFRNNR